MPTRWLCLSYLPRNNFYAHAYPQLITQGCTWDWSEYWCWEDAVTPRAWHDHLFTLAPQRLRLEHQPGLFRCHRDRSARVLAIVTGTFTPYFETFLVSWTSRAEKPSAPVFTWCSPWP